MLRRFSNGTVTAPCPLFFAPVIFSGERPLFLGGSFCAWPLRIFAPVFVALDRCIGFRVMPNSQPLKYCAFCRTFKSHLDFQASGTVKCRTCTQEHVYTHREGVARGRVAPPELTVCPVCDFEGASTAEVVRHLHDQHVVTSGSKKGLVMGLDVTYCHLCKGVFKATFMTHLQKRHGMAGEQYLTRYPKALLYPLRSSDLGGGRMNLGERRKLNRELLNRTGQQCDRCGTIPEDMALHLRRSHLDAMADYHDGYVGPNRDVVHEILNLRRDEDRYWSWPPSRKFVYFIQAGAPDRPIKIGFTQRILYRMRQIQTDAADQLVVLLTVSGDHEDEAVLHERFAHLNVRREWFRPGLELLTYIHDETLKTPTPIELRSPAPVVPMTPLEQMWASVGDNE
jgi:hypothetical protein